MNVHNLFPGVIADPLDKSPIDVLGEALDTVDIDKVVILTVNEVAGQWNTSIHSARMTNAEILLALELMKRNILERMVYNA